MRVSEFSYELPRELIAQHPLPKRDSSKLMVVERATGTISSTIFSDLGKFLLPGDCLVVNNTRVIPARLYGKRETGGKVEIFLIDPFSDTPTALVKPSKKIAPGEKIMFEGGFCATILGNAQAGRYVRFDSPMEEVLAHGHVPLPPYITRVDAPRDREDYQTVYSEVKGATAAPTAGRHFTKELLSGLTASGVKTAHVTLHTNYGTFSPVKCENAEDHRMHAEEYELKSGEAVKINAARSSGGRIFAVGTTSTRTLETCASPGGDVVPGSGKTKLFIFPGYRFRIVDGLITNFHLPGSTLLMLVSAFAGTDIIKKAYAKAVQEKYRFFSYGDAMLII
jgi:S-adenosylmethionine:tRNA ribosyltransferase-isomerase